MGVFTSKHKVLEVGEKGTDLPGGARKHQLQKCPFTLVLEGEQAPSIVLPLEFSVQLLCQCCGQEGWRRAGWWWGPGCPGTLSRLQPLCSRYTPHFAAVVQPELH